MSFSRRNFLQTLGTGATAAIALPVLGVPSASRARFGEAVSDALAGPLLLNANENAYGCSDRVLEAIHLASAASNRYPRSEYETLVQRIARSHRVTPDEVVLGCGSTEVLRMAALAFAGPGKRLVMAMPAYGGMSRCARSLGADISEIPLGKDWSYDLEKMRACMDNRVTLAYICNPNNPTGSITPREQIERFLAGLPENAYALIDEAYHHYMNPSGLYASFLDCPVHHPRLIVTRSFSKIYALAGLRVGYGIAPPDIAAALRSQRLNLSLNTIAAHAAVAALDDTESVERYAKINSDDRQEFLNQVNARMLRAIDPHANFVMVDSGRPADEVISHFLAHDIAIGQKYSPLDDYVRVSLGRPEQMKQFWRVWDLMPPAGPMLM